MLRDLFVEQTVRDREFRSHIRQYNFALTFTFVIYKPNARINNRVNREPVSFQIHEELFHLQGPLQATIENLLCFAQLFFYDPAEATRKRNERYSNLNSYLLRLLTNMLHDCNPFISLYKTANEVLQSNAISTDLRVILNPQMRLIIEEGSDKRRTNLSTSNEMIAIISNEYDLPCDRDILLTKRRNGSESSFMRRINQNHAAYMPLHYVLLFSFGDFEFH